MNSEELFSRASGGQAILEWFGSAPNFHDAVVLEVKLEMSGSCSIRIHAWNLTNKTDSEGHFATEKHAVVVINFATVKAVHLEDFDLNSIIFGLEFKGCLAKTEVSWTSSYGAEGRIVGVGLAFDLVPGKP